MSYSSPTGPTAWERPGATGGTPSRIPPDSHDVLVWYNWPGESTWPNAGTGGTLDLSRVGAGGGRVIGAYSDGCYLAYPLDSAGDGAELRSAATTLGQGQTFSASAWVLLPSLPAGAVLGLLLGRQAGSAGWSAPYSDWALHISSAGELVGVVYTTGQLIAWSDEGVLSRGLHHVGLTCDGSTVLTYADGVQVGSVALDGALATSGGRYLVSGMPVAGTDAPRYSTGATADIRVANTVRSAGWFSKVWNTRRIP